MKGNLTRWNSFAISDKLAQLFCAQNMLGVIFLTQQTNTPSMEAEMDVGLDTSISVTDELFCCMEESGVYLCNNHQQIYRLRL